MKDTTALDDKLAHLSLAEVAAMSDEEVAALMGATPEDLARTPSSHWSWRAAAKAATEEQAARDIAHSEPVTRAEADRYRELARGGRPRLGAGESVQVRARLDPVLFAGLTAVVVATGMSRSEVMRAAVAEYLEQHRPDDEPTAALEEAEVERWLDELGQAVVDDPAGPAEDLREIGAALMEGAAAEGHLHQAIADARSNGRSWEVISLVLGVSTQAARDRFDDADEAKVAPVADLMAALERRLDKAKEQQARPSKRKPAG